MPDDDGYFGEPVAANYDEDANEMFAPEIVNPTVDFLAELDVANQGLISHHFRLQADGTVYTANLRSARCIDTYICRGGDAEVYEPRFTFHGFRYVELTGLKTKPRPDTVTGLVWHTEMAPTGTFTCSDPLVNKLQSNIRWGQRGNFLEVPTDCPQRDERLGWTGDAQVFIPTAAFNYDVASFFRKWTRDLADGQHPTGAYPDTAPDLFFNLWPTNIGGNAAWAEAGVICPLGKNPRSPPFAALPVSCDSARATAPKSVPPRTCFSTQAAFVLAAAFWSAVAFCATPIRM